MGGIGFLTRRNCDDDWYTRCCYAATAQHHVTVNTMTAEDKHHRRQETRKATRPPRPVRSAAPLRSRLDEPLTIALSGDMSVHNNIHRKSGGLLGQARCPATISHPPAPKLLLAIIIKSHATAAGVGRLTVQFHIVRVVIVSA